MAVDGHNRPWLGSTRNQVSVFASEGGGSGSKLPPDVLWSASVSAALATLLSVWCVIQQLRNYRKPILQRFVVRILIMVPIYSISSLISLYSLDASFFIDLIRDIYEAFVIYCFFGLLVEFLGGERSLLILLHGREPTPHPWPISKILPPMDISDPYTFLNLKRGILQYVQVKPLLVILTMIFKATKTYNDGALNSTSGYTYVSIGYNFSVSLCLYCLAIFWMCTAADLKPFRPMPKFLCVKGIIFFSFWQGFGISILVAIGLLKSTRYTTETLSLAIQDTLICFEMPLFALLHLHAFSHKDFIESGVTYCGRLPFVYAFRDSILGFKDVLEDSFVTFKGTGFSYKTFEPSEGALHHQGLVRDRRVRAGLRYSAGGKRKYWLPMAGDNEEVAHGRKNRAEISEGRQTRWKGFLSRVRPTISSTRAEAGYAPLMPDQAVEVVHEEGTSSNDAERRRLSDHLMANVGRWDLGFHGPGEIDSEEDGSDLDEVGFGEPRPEEESLYHDARRLEYGDYNNPVVDASKEEARRQMRAQEEGMLANHPAAPSRIKGKARVQELSHQTSSGPAAKSSLLHDGERVDGCHSLKEGEPGRPNSGFSIPRLLRPGSDKSDSHQGRTSATLSLPEGCVDLLVEDRTAMERRARRERLKGEANRWTGAAPQKVFKVIHPGISALDTHSSSSAFTNVSPQAVRVSIVEDQDQKPKVSMIVDLDDDLQASVTQGPDHSTNSADVISDDTDESEAQSKDEETKTRRHVSLSSSIVQNPWD